MDKEEEARVWLLFGPKTCKHCGRPADYKRVRHCFSCHSEYSKKNYILRKERILNETMDDKFKTNTLSVE